jgi:hypothetical protein
MKWVLVSLFVTFGAMLAGCSEQPTKGPCSDYKKEQLLLGMNDLSEWCE